MSYIYSVKAYSPRSFSKNIFLKNGDSAFIRIEGDSGTIECANKIPDKDLHFIFKLYNLVDKISYIDTEVATKSLNTKQKFENTTAIGSTIYNVSFSEDI